MTRLACLLMLATMLTACAGALPAQIPVSGINGPNGGADEAVYYDKDGHPHFQS